MLTTGHFILAVLMFQATEAWKCVIVELFQRSEIVLKSKFLLASLIHPSNLIFRKFIFSENMKILSSVCQTSMSFSIPFKTLGPIENTKFSLVNSNESMRKQYYQPMKKLAEKMPHWGNWSNQFKLWLNCWIYQEKTIWHSWSSQGIT